MLAGIQNHFEILSFCSAMGRFSLLAEARSIPASREQWTHDTKHPTWLGYWLHLGRGNLCSDGTSHRDTLVISTPSGAPPGNRHKKYCVQIKRYLIYTIFKGDPICAPQWGISSYKFHTLWLFRDHTVTMGLIVLYWKTVAHSWWLRIWLGTGRASSSTFFPFHCLWTENFSSQTKHKGLFSLVPMLDFESQAGGL
jgi:hypothetical protein